MADLKPKGRDEGFSAHDREKGAEWLRGMIGKFGPTIKANCYQIVNYKGGIHFEGEIGGKNINQLALMQGLAVPNPNLLPKQAGAFMMAARPMSGFRPPPIRPIMPQHQEWDADYLEYGGAGRAGSAGQGRIILESNTYPLVDEIVIFISKECPSVLTSFLMLICNVMILP